MVAAGTAGAAIVGALAASSATFAAKTEFSQEKYLKRKGRKYIFGAVARRPTAATLVAACWSKHPARVGYLRHDALALMLNLADAGAGARLLVIDTCGGLVTAAAGERLGGDGDLCAAFVGAAAPAAMDAGRVLNLGAKVKAAIRTVPLLALLRERRAQLAAEAAEAAEAEPAAMDADGAGAAAPAEARANGANGAAPSAAAALARGPPFTGLIVAALELEPLALVRRCLPLLAPSAAVVVYGPWAEPVAACHAGLRADGSVVGLSLAEPWLRELQVLPGRTHPMMNMHNGGGFLLSGTATVDGVSRPIEGEL
jgi:tRNA (adenine-N(1)-)-methyltransferase non-catalytic subunit